MRTWRAVIAVFAIVASQGAHGAVSVREDVSVTAAAQAPFAPLEGGDIGAPTLGASLTSATVTLGSMPVLVANDFLRLDSTDAAWQVHAELTAQSGWSALEAITISLADGVLTRTQIAISLGAVGQAVGLPVDLPTTGDTELRVIGTGTGMVSLDLVLQRDGGASPTIRYAVTLTVG
jgi:hypothetical protein